MGMQLVIEGAAAEAFAANVQRYLHLDATKQDEFKEGLRRLLAAQYVLEDLLVQAGLMDPLTPQAVKARTNNPFYVPTLANAGDNP